MAWATAVAVAGWDPAVEVVDHWAGEEASMAAAVQEMEAWAAEESEVEAVEVEAMVVAMAAAEMAAAVETVVDMYYIHTQFGCLDLDDQSSIEPLQRMS